MYKLREPSSQSSVSLASRSRRSRYRSTNAASSSRRALSACSAAHVSFHRARHRAAFFCNDAIPRATILLAIPLLHRRKRAQRLLRLGESKRRFIHKRPRCSQPLKQRELLGTCPLHVAQERIQNALPRLRLLPLTQHSNLSRRTRIAP